MILAVLALVALAAFGALCPKRFAAEFGLGIAIAIGGIGAWFASKASGVLNGQALIQTHEWVPSLGVELAMRLDGLSLVFALLICFIGAIVVLYTSSYLADSAGIARFYATLISFMAAMLGLVLADDLITLFIFWELTSITSFLLIGFDFKRERARACAWQSLLVTNVGGLSLLAGVVLLAIAAGELNMPHFRISTLDGAKVLASPLIVPATVLILIGCFTKSAIFPFHFWLPNAMEAPSPVSALLHSSTMVKAGVYLMARLSPTLAGAPFWEEALVAFGGATMLFAAIMATRFIEFKKILAYSTVSSLGTLTMLIGLGATKAVGVYLIAHALYKACLFLIAGSVAHAANSYDTEGLHGLRSRMPITASSAFLGALSMAGMLPFLGFAAKELLIKATIDSSFVPALLAGAVVIAAVLTVFAAIQVGIKPFARRFGHEPPHTHEVSWREWAGPAMLALGGLVFGILPMATIEVFSRGVASAIGGIMYQEEIELRFWRLVWPANLAAGLSVLALVAGGTLFAIRNRYRAMLTPLARLDAFGPEIIWERSIGVVLRLARLSTATLQNGSLRSYTRVTLLAVVTVCGISMIRTQRGATFPNLFTIAEFMDWILLVVIAAAALGATFVQARLGVISILGAIGFALALFFVLHGAPDVAATQFAVETLIVIIFVLVIRHLPKLGRYTSRISRSWDAIVATLVGVLVFSYALLAVSQTPDQTISVFHAEESVPSAYGRNIVNVILVDFRAMDTLGEIFVLAIAAVGVFTLLTIRPSRALMEKA